MRYETQRTEFVPSKTTIKFFQDLVIRDCTFLRLEWKVRSTFENMCVINWWTYGHSHSLVSAVLYDFLINVNKVSKLQSEVISRAPIAMTE